MAQVLYFIVHQTMLQQLLLEQTQETVLGLLLVAIGLSDQLHMVFIQEHMLGKPTFSIILPDL